MWILSFSQALRRTTATIEVLLTENERKGLYQNSETIQREPYTLHHSSMEKVRFSPLSTWKVYLPLVTDARRSEGSKSQSPHSHQWTEC